MAPPAVSRKRPPATVAIGTSRSKKIRPGVVKNEAGAAAPPASATAAAAAAPTDAETKKQSMRERFLKVFENSEYRTTGISNSLLRELFGDADYVELAPIINSLLGENRLSMSRSAMTNELCYTLKSEELAQQMAGLDTAAIMVYETIERAGNILPMKSDRHTYRSFIRSCFIKRFILFFSFQGTQAFGRRIFASKPIFSSRP